MRKIAFITAIFLISAALLAATPVRGQVYRVADVKTDRPAINSGMTVALSWSGEGIHHYKLYTFCRPGISVWRGEKSPAFQAPPLRKGEKSVCNQVLPLGSETAITLRAENRGGEPQEISFELDAYDEFDSLREHRTFPVTVYAASSPQITTLHSFEADLQTVFSGSEVKFNWSGTRVGRYELSLTCPPNVSLVSESVEFCNQTQSFDGVTAISGRVKNILEQSRTVQAMLKAYSPEGVLAEERTLALEVLPVKAKIGALSLSSIRVPSRGTVTAYFTGEHIEVFEFILSCPRPTTLEGVLERINLVRNHYSPGLSASLVPKEELDSCPSIQTGPGTLARFSFRPWNPFKNPQGIILEVRGNTLDGERRVLGDAQFRSVVVTPEPGE